MILIFFFLSFWLPVKETYYVTLVKGKVIVERTNKPLKTGDEFYDTDRLKFSTKDDLVAAISGKGQRVKLTAANAVISSSTPQSEFLSVMASMSTVRKQASTRGFIKMSRLENNQVAEFFAASYDQDLNTGTYTPENFLILGTGEYFIPKFPQNEKQYFFIEYKFQGEVVHIPLPSEKRVLKIDKSIFKNGDSFLDLTDVEDLKLYFRNMDKQPRIEITPFKPIFIDEEALKQELTVLIEKSKPFNNNRIDILIDEIMPYLHDYYGKPDLYNVKVWLEKNMNFLTD